MKNIAIFASGTGTNAQNIIRQFNQSNIVVAKIFSNNSQAGVLSIAKQHNIPSYIFSKDDFYSSSNVIDELASSQIDYIVLAGFLWLLPANLIQAYNQKIINIHPSLLPKYGGKGMYGMHVHNAVVANKESVSGITIHLVDEIYDNGKILFQVSTTVLPTDTADDVASKIHELEYKHFPTVIKEWICE